MQLTRRRFLLSAALASGPALLLKGRAQGLVTPAAPPDDTGRPVASPSANFYPYSGVSGPGRPAHEYSYHGGWRSGSFGVAYQGPDPQKFIPLPWKDYATGTATANGLLPKVKPLLEVHVRDTVVCRGGDGFYYMTGSTGDNIWAFNDGVELWKSPDLKAWTYLGLVWSIEKDGGWERQWRTLHGQPSRAVWAPEIHFVRGNFYICLSMAPHGISILRSTTGKAEGPYRHAFAPDKPVVDGIDPTLFEDDDGTVYLTYGAATRIVQLNNDLSGFAGEWRRVQLLDPVHLPSQHAAKCVKRGMDDLGHEGAVLFKANGRYYLGAADNPEGRYSTMLAMADNVFGPYRHRHESVPCGGGTNFFKDHHGQWWSAYFGNDNQSAFLEKPAIVAVEFDAEGRVRVVKGKRE
jgi:xylan 1,4-beta-xylosidase